MKQILLFTLSFLAVLSCGRFDHEEILEQLRDHENRIQQLEAECRKLNSNVEAMQAVLEALEGNDYVTDIVKIMEEGVEVGYSITFAQSGTVTIYHGSNGSDGSTPKIGIKKASDGQYYWTADEEWLTDEEGNKIPAAYDDGGNGKYITPQFRIAEGVWYISYDNGNSWMEIVEEEEEEVAPPLFLDVTYDSDYVYLTLGDGSEIAIPLKSQQNEGYTKSPYVEIGPINNSGGFGVYDWGLAYYRTPRFMSTVTSDVTLCVSSDCEVQIAQYDKDFAFLGLTSWTVLKTDQDKKFTLKSNCKYIRLMFRKDSSICDFPKPHVIVKNVGVEDFYNIRPSDNGYQQLTIPVNVSGTNTSDNDSWEVQDQGTYMKDYGLLVLPETYSNIGKPTRLIIYCHGAGVNYPSTVTRFSASSHVQPEYWLKEGYAVMDIEGNPFDNTNEHFYIPQARQAYESAYNWVINAYNICQDGVFVGGRSMGGGMCFELLQSHIPVLAACPLAPCTNPLWLWSYISSARKSFCAEKMGFQGTPPAWGSNKKLTDEEFQYLYDNFDYLVRSTPFWRGIENLPDKDVLFSISHISPSVKYDEAEAALYSTLRYKAKAPVKIFSSYEDNVVPYRRNSELMYQMMKNAGQVCELRLFHTDAASPHNFEVQDSRYLTEVTTVYGETMQAPLVYVEMLQFWRRYEPR